MVGILYLLEGSSFGGGILFQRLGTGKIGLAQAFQAFLQAGFMLLQKRQFVGGLRPGADDIISQCVGRYGIRLKPCENGFF